MGKERHLSRIKNGPVDHFKVLMDHFKVLMDNFENLVDNFW